MRSVELFTGAGGLALGAAKAGFHHEAVVELDHYACQTIRENQRRHVPLVRDWPLLEADVANLDYSWLPDGIDLLAGGPPCQPWSLGGKHTGHHDRRNLFPEVARAIRELRPRTVLIENVKGLLRESFARYYEYILLQIAYPDIIRHREEEWLSHLSRLERYHTQGSRDGLFYRVVFRVLNAADYGVPQRRERVFIIAFRGDLEVSWSFPEPTHSQDALLWDQWVTGAYWERHSIPTMERPAPPTRLLPRIERLRQALFPPGDLAWLTVRDAIADLPDPRTPNTGFLNHRFQPGAKAYLGHTGSPLDEPAKTIKAGDHGVPGGENTVVDPGGAIRYLTARETARLQTFPDEFLFHGSWSEIMRQLGNAVPVTLAHVVTNHLRERLDKEVA